MKAISFWAMRNPSKARFLATIIKLLLAFLAAYTGLLFAKLNIVFTSLLLYISALTVFVFLLIYPKQNKRSRPFFHAYVWQKTCDAGIIICSFISIMVMMNNIETQQPLPALAIGASTAHVKPTAKEILESLKHRDKSSLTRQEKKILRKELFRQLKIYTISAAKDDKEAKKHAGLIVLTIIGALSITLTLAALVCAIACNGSEVAAIVVGIIGLAAIIWGMIAIINSITGKTKKKKPAATSP